jgi:6,7-dimethyl-8-ribityllumazine synthase
MGVVGKLSQDSLKVQSHWKIIIVQAIFNQDITQKITDSAKSRLLSLGINENQIKVVQVPGALEVPLTIKWAFESGYDAAIATGAVIRGETTHYEYVCSGVEKGCTEIQLTNQKPIAQAVLTTENRAQALDRCGGDHGDKGAESAEVIVSMLNLKAALAQGS